MTKMIYDVIERPKKDSTGRTDIGWEAECGRNAVPLGGYLITRRTPPSEKKQYTAMVISPKPESGQVTIVETMVGTNFETRATAAFAIWRKYYEGWRAKRADKKADVEAILEQKSLARASRRQERQTPEGQKAYREELNRKARERRANMTDDEREKETLKRRLKREDDAFTSTYTST